MERFIINLDFEGETRRYLVRPSENNGNMYYVANIDGHDIPFIGNPSWDKNGAMLIPAIAPAEIDLMLLEDIAEKIDAHFM